MAKRATPKENVEYVFRFRKGDKTCYVTLIFEGINEKNRCVFYNKQSGAFTSMLPERFSYIHRFNLVRETYIEPKKEKPLEPKSVKAEEQEIKPGISREDAFKQIIVDLKSLSPEAENRVLQVVGKRPSELVDEIEAEINRPFSARLELFDDVEKALAVCG